MNLEQYRPSPGLDPAEVEDVDQIVLADGTVLTDSKADALVERLVASATPGRPSLTGPGVHSPTISLRLDAATVRALDQQAAREGRRRSELVRDALAAYLQPA